MATAPGAVTEKKANPNAPKPKGNLLMIGAVMVLLGGAWGIYERVRPRTPDEMKEIKEEESIEKEKQREAEREAKRHAH
jgi:ABC-type nickel/cobalt efflux system permease component RcnA